MFLSTLICFYGQWIMDYPDPETFLTCFYGENTSSPNFNRYQNLEFDQLILEFYQKGKPSSGWVHCSYKTNGENRQKVMTALRVNGKTEYKEGIIK